MKFQVSFNVNEKLFLRNPESSVLGKKIIKYSIELIHEIGFENFTFKKLSIQIQTTEASIYRYFENKHRLLLYILNWYWCYMNFLVNTSIENISEPKIKLKIIIELLANDLKTKSGTLDYNIEAINQIVISESSKAYLVKDIKNINKDHVFQPFKDLCTKIASIINEYNPSFKFARSLSSTIIETSHTQQYFAKNLPKLTDLQSGKPEDFTLKFLENIVFKLLD